MGGAIALELARAARAQLGERVLAGGLLDAAERRFCQLSLAPLAHRPPAPAPRAGSARAHRAGRARAVLADLRLPRRVPARRGGRDAARRLGLARVRGRAGGLRRLPFAAREELRRRARRDRLGRCTTGCCPMAARRRARGRCCRRATISLGAGHVPFFDDPPVIAETLASAPAAERRPAALFILRDERRGGTRTARPRASEAQSNARSSNDRGSRRGDEEGDCVQQRRRLARTGPDGHRRGARRARCGSSSTRSSAPNDASRRNYGFSVDSGEPSTTRVFAASHGPSAPPRSRRRWRRSGG